MVEVLLWGSLADQADGARKVDGRVYNDSWFQPIAEDSEVVLLKRLKGG
jgi:hypothetical protein